MNIFGKRSKEKKQLDRRDIVYGRPVFGVPLFEAVSVSRCHDGVPVPLVVRECIGYVEEQGMKAEGIYRISAPKARLDEQEAGVNCGEREIKFHDPHEAAGLLKRFLRQLPEHILTAQLKPLFDQASSSCKCGGQAPCECQAVEDLSVLMMKRLPRENYSLLGYVFIHAKRVVAQQKANKMGLSALGVLLQATLNISKNQVRIFLLNACDLDESGGGDRQVAG